LGTPFQRKGGKKKLTQVNWAQENWGSWQKVPNPLNGKELISQKGGIFETQDPIGKESV